MRMSRLVSIVAGAVAPLVLPSATTQAITTTACIASGVKATSDDTDRNTMEATFVNMPGATMGFTVGGASPSCVIVLFSAEVATDTTTMRIRATLDGNRVGLPDGIVFAENSSNFLPATTTFFFSNVAVGTHRLNIQYVSAIPGQAVYVRNTNLIVHYAR